MMASRTAFSDSNDFSTGSSGCSVGPHTAHNNSHDSSSADNVVSREAFAPADFAALRRLSHNLESFFKSDDFELYADAKIAVGSGKEIAVHRCILAARSPYLKLAFASCKERDRGDKDGRVRFDLKELAGDFDVGFDAVKAVLAYLYSGKLNPLPGDVCICVEVDCLHVGCRPAVDFMLEVLYLSFTFQIAELVSLYQRRLMEILDKITPEDLLIVLYVANLCETGCQLLYKRCVEILVESDVDIVALEKSLPLPMHIIKQIMDERKKLGLISLQNTAFPDMHAKRIHRALDSDDIELVTMLLKEGHTTLDDAYALHYAVAYCDVKTTSELLGLGLADVNRRNLRGFSVLHVAAMRREPTIIILLLKEGARPTDVARDGRNALQISKRLTKAADWHKSPEERMPSHKDRLCIEILEQAERGGPMFFGEGSLSVARAGDDLRSRLLDLENRVGLARLLFPEEAKVAMEIADVDSTTELISRETLDSNEAPFIIKEEHHQRIRALHNTGRVGLLLIHYLFGTKSQMQRSVGEADMLSLLRLGKRFFPRCSQKLDWLVDTDFDDLTDLVNMDSNTQDERLVKKQRFMQIQETVRKAFTEDVEVNRRSRGSASSSVPMGGKHRLGRLTYKK